MPAGDQHRKTLRRVSVTLRGEIRANEAVIFAATFPDNVKAETFANFFRKHRFGFSLAAQVSARSERQNGYVETNEPNLQNEKGSEGTIRRLAVELTPEVGVEGYLGFIRPLFDLSATKTTSFSSEMQPPSKKAQVF